MKREQVTIYCASSPMVDSCFFEATDRLAQLLALRGTTIVYGAGKQGLMGCVADGVLSRGGKAIGVIPRFMVERDWCHNNLTQLVVTENMHERKESMAQMGKAAIALPGGCGTLEELLEIITWKQLGLYTHPIIILNTANYYTPLLQMLQNAIDNHFMRDIHASLWYVAQTPEEVIAALDSIEEWDATMGKFAVVK
ncbi:MAG: TIGR00730 family Rossman fold protein [Bacteroidaceae bacterium]|nr:TIGR00730 family Rossman fold protein [Bacteroidaceae bacterium]